MHQLKLSWKTKRRTIEPALKHWKRKRTKSSLSRKTEVEKDEDGIVFDRDALMDKEQRLAERALQELREQEEAIAETL